MKGIVVITGCSSGIGFALAKAFHQQNYRVIATARKLESLESLRVLGCTVKSLDVNSEQSRLELAQSISEEFGYVDILVNNAGISSMGPMVEMPLDKLRHQFETNVFSPVMLIQAMLPLLERSQQATIVNVGSISATLVTPFAGAYCASKAAINNISEALRLELAPLGIRVIAVQPGAIQSNFGDAASAGISEWLSENSRYAAIKKGIYARAQASQKNATPANEFAERLVAELNQAPASVMHIGKGSRLLPIVAKWLPEKMRTKILSRKFNLDGLRIHSI
ncbi:MAG: SDR family oxidoreductase [Pseudomonadales bacterium]|nr:SDR family oxidoreductase [Pseudomonadales bacterium]